MLRNALPTICAIVIIGAFYLLSRPASLSIEQARIAAQRYRFEGFELPKLSTKPPQSIRQVHPSLEHLAAWISFVGAAVSLGDLDNDGLPNDLIYVDPRYDEISVSPVPGTGDRFAPFVLRVDSLPFDEDSTAPMGTLIGDFNEDGLPDILAYYWGRSPIIFLRRGESADHSATLGLTSFEPIELVSPHQVWHTSCALQADLDGDGHLDLVIGNYNPDGALTLDSRDTQHREVMMGSWGRATNGGKSRMLLWVPNDPSSYPKFVDQPGVLADHVAQGWAFALGAADLDGDLLPEVYLVHDFGADVLLHNRSKPGALNFQPLIGAWTPFTPRSQRVGMDTFNGMGIDFADVNGDGLMDFIVSNITSDYGIHQSNLLFVNSNRPDLLAQGVAPFQSEAEKYGVSRSGWSWDIKFGDFDNDGIDEIVVATGFLKGEINRWPELHELALGNEETAKYPIFWPRLGPHDDISGSEPNAFFAKSGERYFDIGEQMHTMFREPHLSRGIALGDVDGDGDIDMVWANQWEDSFFFRNDLDSENEYLALSVQLLVGDSSGEPEIRAGRPDHQQTPSRPAIGAKVSVTMTGDEAKRVRIAEVDGGNGHSGHCAPQVHFGLGTGPVGATLTVQVQWRDSRGSVQSCQFEGIAPGQHTIYLTR